MTTDNNEAQVRAIIDARIAAVRERNVDGATSNVATDILSFDVVNPLRRLGSDASSERAEEWFSSFEGQIDHEIRDLGVTASDTLAFAHGLSHVSAKKADGGELDMWWRTTLCFLKVDGKWLLTHEHNSVPFDVESGKASLDLKP